jgi:hypothetical protein
VSGIFIGMEMDKRCVEIYYCVNMEARCCNGVGLFYVLEKNGFLKIKTAKAPEYSEALPHEKQNTTPLFMPKAAIS